MRILVVEDDGHIAGLVKKVLEEESHAVDIAPDGVEGEFLALTEPYDVVILDVMLPGKDGASIVRAMRREGCDTPVLMLTARGEVSERVAGLDAGADDYLVKPFALTELLARVRALLRRRTQDKSPLLSAGALSLDPVAHQVRVHGRLVELTAREFAILEYLLRNKNRLLSKGMIADHVWDCHFESDYNLIEVYMRRLRQKIEKKGREKWIRTVKNGGYSIRDPEV